MKRLGLIGGISWQSTHSDHQYLNELGMILDQRDFDIPAFDSTRIHAGRAVELMLS